MLYRHLHRGARTKEGIPRENPEDDALLFSKNGKPRGLARSCQIIFQPFPFYGPADAGEILFQPRE